MSFPPRLGHLATRAVVIAKIAPSYAQMHQVDQDEANERLERALSTSLLDELLESTWRELTAKSKRLDEAGLLEKIAGSLKDRPLRAGRLPPPSPAWSAFLLILDVQAGTASDAVRHVLETPAGKERIAAGLAEGARFLAAELTR